MAPSFWQIAIVVAIIFLLFGAGKLPRIMSDIAGGIKSFKKGMKEEEDGEENADAQISKSDKSDDDAK